MKILCFGDSNTYGYDPRSYFGGQYGPEHRWVDILAKKLGCKAVNAGENGREIPRREWELIGFDLMMTNQKPLDLLLIMLGGNDLLQGNSVEAVTERMEKFLGKISLDKDKIVLIAPPAMKPGAWITRERLLEDSVQLISAYRSVAHKAGIRFVDTTDWEIEVTFDGVHYSEKGHHIFAENLSQHLKI